MLTCKHSFEAALSKFGLPCVHRYKREDGLDLTATLYLPPGYDKERDGRLPCILWAYPREFKTKVGACVLLLHQTGMKGSTSWQVLKCILLWPI